ncbi:hypothetical protein E3N88_06664 [Mikania micrantha]|uniref:Uncharacterized protein n=1 Tax=Mikania micrantha TaxID=192012 RepID=A0A5N6PPD6_9ASTR|nr:hypothetical protein E3N88_06664 [Mikania micrantha]
METRNQNSRLDSHEQQIKQLQADVTEIKQLLTEGRTESAEFRKMMVAWMKKFEKQPEDSEGSGSGPKISDPYATPPFDHFEQLATIQQSDLISDFIEDVEDTWIPNSADRKVSLPPFPYQNCYGPLIGDGPQVLDQGEPKSVTHKLTERVLPVCSNNIHSVLFTTPG